MIGKAGQFQAGLLQAYSDNMGKEPNIDRVNSFLLNLRLAMWDSGDETPVPDDEILLK